MADTVAGQAVEFINRIGIFNVLVPFMLGFGITYGMLDKTKVFNNRGVNILIAVAAGLIAALTFAA